MTLIYAQMSISLDGYIAGPRDDPGNPLGDGGERVHQWIFDVAAWRAMQGMSGGRSGPDDAVVRETVDRNGAIVMGRHMFATGEEPWGAEPPFHAPVFVVTHREREPLERQGGTTFHFVTDGLEAAVDRARAAAGGKDVEIAGGADVVRQALVAGLLDELEVHVSPVLLGGGRRLFGEDERLAGVRLEQARVVHSPAVAHIRYTVVHNQEDAR